MRRTLVLFAREPARQARDKGLRGPEAGALFAAIASGWSDAARRARATLIVAAPPEDLPAWRRRLGTGPGVSWHAQRGATFGERLREAARRGSARRARTVVVGGDVPPSLPRLREAFRALEAGGDAVVAPAPDGGVSLIALRPADLDLLAAMAPRRRDVARLLLQGLARRRRRVKMLRPVADLDGRRDLAVLSRRRGRSPLRALARLARPGRPVAAHRPAAAAPKPRRSPLRLRAPPAS